MFRKVRSVHPSTLAPEPQSTKIARRRSPEVPVMRPEVLGTRFSDHASLPAAVWNQVSAAIADAFKKVIGRLDRAYRAGIEDRLLELVQTELREVLHEAGRGVIESVLREERGYQGVRIQCNECDGALEFEGNRLRKFSTAMGSISMRRAYYHGACGHSAFPLDQLIGIEKHAYVPQLQEAIALLACRVPYEEAVETLGRLLPVKMSTETSHRIVADVAAEVAAQQEEEPFVTPISPPPEVAVAAVDGCMYRTRSRDEQFREVKIGVLGTVDSLEGRRGDAENKHYVSTLSGADDLFRRLVSAYYSLGLNLAPTLVVLGDGAAWIWHRIQMLLAPGQELVAVLDYFHASEHLRELSRVVFGEDSKVGLVWWTETCLKLKTGQLKSFFARLRALRRKCHGEALQAVERELNFFNEKRPYLQYALCRERGLPIGSGMVEGGVRFIAKDRLHRTGMRWSERGAADVLCLRCVDASGQWDATMRALSEKRRLRFKSAQSAWLSAA